MSHSLILSRTFFDFLGKPSTLLLTQKRDDSPGLSTWPPSVRPFLCVRLSCLSPPSKPLSSSSAPFSTREWSAEAPGDDGDSFMQTPFSSPPSALSPSPPPPPPRTDQHSHDELGTESLFLAPCLSPRCVAPLPQLTASDRRRFSLFLFLPACPCSFLPPSIREEADGRHRKL